ncbi:hypothetical protein VTP01DRAFT_756 [Rhizomucor pusillus]|uniref:uncharacterized protein n=1 Tax=Rhizomucor pusillus TaxID=4840 RepID=UPI0037429416
MVSSISNYSAIPQNPEEARDVREARRSPNIKLFRIGTAVLACLAGIALVGAAVVLFTDQKPAKRNVIMMISDGFGPASETYARQYHGWRLNLPPKSLLPLDNIHVGHSRTQSSSSLVTDSAAGATAFSCAHKSYNGAIGVYPDKSPCGTVLEAAKLQHDMITGLVVTSRITHATPGAFSAHVDHRDKENQIAEQQLGYNPLGRVVDLMFGGGECEFLSNLTEGSCRTDQRDLLSDGARDFGWSFIRSKQDFDTLDDSVSLPLAGLFAPSHMSYEIDRNDKRQPSLREMTTKALSILNKASKDADRGFFLMIEGSRIDMAAHSNDPAAHVHDIWEYHQTAEAVLEFAKSHPNTVVISTSDHETGGLTVGRQVGEDYPEYKWNPIVISRVRNSTEVLAQAWNTAHQENIASADFLSKVIIENGLGIEDATEEEIERLLSWKAGEDSVDDFGYILADMVSRRALIGWTTHGHTAVDVNLYAYGPGTEELHGSHENTDIGDFIASYLGLDLAAVTRELQSDPELMTFAAEGSQPIPPSRHERFYD